MEYYRTADIVRVLNENDYNRFTKIKMIIDKWDPLGVLSYTPSPAPTDEYDMEALYVLKVLKTSGSVDDIARIFLRCFHISGDLSSMNEARRKDIENRYSEIAKVLFKL